MHLPIIIAVVFAAGIATGAENEYFTAAVFESIHLQDSSATTKADIVSANMKAYQKAVETASKKGVDIIVFSEYGLFPHNRNRTVLKTFTEYTPDPQKVKTNPCNEEEAYKDRQILLSLSCLAQHYGMYIVANVGDRQPCESQVKSCEANNVGCKAASCIDGDYIYNTDVAFDREGNLVAKYHKNHLYFEVMDTPDPFEMITFKTEFGVFGMIVCFDSVFKEAAELIEKYNVETLLFPTYWYDDIVPLNAIEWQQGWALGNKVNFLAANGYAPNTGSLGSGIYSENYGALVYTYNPDGRSRLLIARVPRKDAEVEQEVFRYVITQEGVHEESGEDGSAFPEHCYDKQVGPAQTSTDYRCFKAQVARYSLKKLEEKKGNVELCHNDFCCKISYSANKMDEDYYVAVFNGTNDVRGYFKWAEESCLLVRCDPFEGKPCVTFPSTSTTTFDFIGIKATFTASAHVYPAVSTTNYRLAPKLEYDFKKKDRGKAMLKYKSKSGAPLLKAALYGRCYERDPPFVPFPKV